MPAPEAPVSLLGLAVLEILSANAPELEFVPIAVAAAAAVGAIAGAPVGLVAGLGARAPLTRGNVTAARAIVGSVGAIGAGATVAGWFLTSVLLRPHD